MGRGVVRREEILETIRRLAREHLEHDGELRPSSRLVEDLDLDSVRRLTLAIEIEDHFRICLDPEDEASIETVGDLVETVGRKLEQARTG